MKKMFITLKRCYFSLIFISSSARGALDGLAPRGSRLTSLRIVVTSLAGSASGPLPADGWRDIDDFGGLAAGQWRN